jgi:hypothetical protein
MGKFFHHPFFIRLFNWEYWPFNAVYVWTMPAWFYFCVRSRSLFFFTASNPCIENGGLIGESKKDIHQILPKNRFPATVHFTAGRPGTEVVAAGSVGGVVVGKASAIGFSVKVYNYLQSIAELTIFYDQRSELFD